MEASLGIVMLQDAHHKFHTTNCNNAFVKSENNCRNADRIIPFDVLLGIYAELAVTRLSDRC